MWFIPPWVHSSILLPCPPLLHTNLTLPVMLFSLKPFRVLLCSLNITSSESINILAKGKILSFCDKQHLLNYMYIYICLYIYHRYHISFIYSSFIGYRYSKCYLLWVYNKHVHKDISKLCLCLFLWIHIQYQDWQLTRWFYLWHPENSLYYIQLWIY